jgi:hypothetical protein
MSNLFFETVSNVKSLARFYLAGTLILAFSHGEKESSLKPLL